MHPEVFGLETSERLRVDFLGEFLFRNQLDPFAAAADVERGFVGVNAEAWALCVYTAARNRNHVAAGKLRQQLDMLGHFAFRSPRHGEVAVHIVGANRTHSHWEFGSARRQHERVEPVRHQIAVQPAAISVILSPAVEVFGAERHAGFHLAEPALPVNVFSLRFFLDQIVPFAWDAVAAVVTLTPNQGPQFTALNELGALMPARGGTALRADLVNLAGALDGIIYLEGLIQVAGHRLLTIDVFARFHRLD